MNQRSLVESAIVRVGRVIVLALSSCTLGCGVFAGSERGAILALDCEDGTLTPLLEVPEAEWDPTVSRGLELMATHWASPFSATLHCPEGPDQEIEVAISGPGVADLAQITPPRSVPRGAMFGCTDVAGGTAQITLSGFNVDGRNVFAGSVPLAVHIKVPDWSSAIDASAEETLTDSSWNRVLVNVGIDNSPKIYGSIYLIRDRLATDQSAGEAAHCTMSEFTTIMGRP